MTKRLRKRVTSRRERPPRRRDGPATAERILRVAEMLLARHGFEGVSTKQIAARAGIAIGALYHHFPSKEFIYAAVTRRAFATRSALPPEILESQEAPAARLVQLVAWFIRHVVMDETFGPLLQREMLDPRSSTPRLLDKNQFEQQLRLFEQLILEIAPGANTDEAVAVMLALIFGFSNMRGIYALFPRLHQQFSTAEEIAVYATRLLIGSLSEDR